MKLSTEEESRIIEESQGFIRTAVAKFRRHSLHKGDDMQDLYQVACAAFLIHIRDMRDMSQIYMCGRSLFGAMYRYIEEMFVVKVRRNDFAKTAPKISKASLHNLHPLGTTEWSAVLDRIAIEAFLKTLPTKQVRAYLLKREGYTYREIMEMLDEPYVSVVVRMVKKTEMQLRDYIINYLQD